MSIETAIRAKIITDAAVVALLSGGVYAYADLLPGGLNRANYEAAFDTTTGLRLPCAVIRTRIMTFDRSLADAGAQVKGRHQIVQIEFLGDPTGGYTNLTSARDLVHALLDERKVVDAGYGRLVNRIEYGTDPELDDALFHRDDYQYTGVLG